MSHALSLSHPDPQCSQTLSTGGSAGPNPYPAWINSTLVLSSLGLIIGGLRAFSVLIEDSGEEFVLDLGDRFDKGLVIALNLILLVLGLFPGISYQIAQTITDLMMGS